MTKRAPIGRAKQPSHKDRRMDKLTADMVANNLAIVEGPTKRKTWSLHDLKAIKPLTQNQQVTFETFLDEQKSLCLYGCSGVGKTFQACYLALNEVLRKDTPTDKIIIVRSIVPTREIGFLPGDLEEKTAVYEMPYQDIFADLCGRNSTYDNMKEAGLIQFCCSSFIRGLTWDNCIVVVDEAQNMSWQEFDSIITRVGCNTKVIVCGDTRHQCDLKKEHSGFIDAINVMERTGNFGIINFTSNDIVRSSFVKDWIIAREQLNL